MNKASGPEPVTYSWSKLCSTSWDWDIIHKNLVNKGSCPVWAETNGGCEAGKDPQEERIMDEVIGTAVFYLDCIIPTSLPHSSSSVFILYSFLLLHSLLMSPLSLSPFSHSCLGILPLHLSDFWNGWWRVVCCLATAVAMGTWPELLHLLVDGEKWNWLKEE